MFYALHNLRRCFDLTIFTVGTWAAAAQAAIGNVVAGSPFAIAQGVGAGAALPFIGFVGAAAIGATVIGGGYTLFRRLTMPPQAVICPQCGGLI